MPFLPARQSWQDQCISLVVAYPSALQANTHIFHYLKGPSKCDVQPTLTIDGSILAPDGHHVEPANTTSVSAFRLKVNRFALFVEETGLVDGGSCRRLKRNWKKREVVSKLLTTIRTIDLHIHLYTYIYFLLF